MASPAVYLKYMYVRRPPKSLGQLMCQGTSAGKGSVHQYISCGDFEWSLVVILRVNSFTISLHNIYWPSGLMP